MIRRTPILKKTLERSYMKYSKGKTSHSHKMKKKQSAKIVEWNDTPQPLEKEITP